MLEDESKEKSAMSPGGAVLEEEPRAETPKEETWKRDPTGVLLRAVESHTRFLKKLLEA